MKSLFLNISIEDFENRILKLSNEELNLKNGKKLDNKVFITNKTNDTFDVVLFKRERMIGTIQFPLTTLKCNYYSDEKNVVVKYCLKKQPFIFNIIKMLFCLIITSIVLVLSNKLYVLSDNYIVISIVFVASVFASVIPSFKEIRILESFILQIGETGNGSLSHDEKP